ncbi:MAG TPA: hypothetical protein VK002_11410 [Rubricoccaceae bacterium]|nr:hypothetical protein [Rubricoccaceae bacterium]
MRLAVLLLLALAAGADAQPSYGAVEERQTNVPAFFFHVLPGEPTISVYVWGTVRAPGLYEVGTGTDLGELLTLTGGPEAGPETEDRVVTTTVRVFRAQGDARVLAYEAVLDEVVREPGRYPDLRDNDIVEVETTVEEVGGFSWRDALSVVTSVAAVALAVERISSLF